MKYAGMENEYTVFAKNPGSGRIEKFDFFSAYNGNLKRRFNRLGLVKKPYPSDTNLWLKNGGRVYRDVGTSEYASPECESVREAVLAEKAGEVIIRVLNAPLGAWRPHIYVMKRSAPETGDPSHTWGSHENYAINAQLWHEIVQEDLAKSAVFKLHLLTRLVFAGSGHLFCRFDNEKTHLLFALSPRMHYMRHDKNANTRFGDRALINTRDEPLMDGDLAGYKRLHLICGDMNRSDWSIYLRTGTTAAILDYLRIAGEGEAARIARMFPAYLFNLRSAVDVSFSLNSGAESARIFSYFVSAQRALQRAVYSRRNEIRKTFPEINIVLRFWGEALDAVANKGARPGMYAKRLDWLVKKNIFEDCLGSGIVDIWRRDLDQKTRKRLLSLDFSYSRVNRGDLYRTLVKTGRAETRYTPREVAYYCLHPPTGRARERTEFMELLQRESLFEWVAEFDWKEVCFSVPQGNQAPNRRKSFEFCSMSPQELQSRIEYIKRWIEEG